MPKKRRRPETYEATHKGRKVRVTVPDAVDEQILFDAIRDNLSPQAVAAVAAFLRAASTNNRAVNRQIQWFATQLIELVGGGDEHNRLCEEVGL